MSNWKRLFLLLLLFANISYAQLHNDTIIRFKNGQTKSSLKYISADTIQRINYYQNGKIKDSTWYKIETFVAVKAELDKRKGLQDSIIIKTEIGVGTGKKYYKNGHLKSVTIYGNETAAGKTREYSKKGKLMAYKETPFGEKLTYTKKGKTIRYANINKGTQVYVPKNYRNQKHLTGTTYPARIKTKNLVLTKNKNKVKLKAGAIISFQLKSDSIKYNNCLIEGFSRDSVYISKFEYDLNPESKNKLKYDSTFVLSAGQLRSIFYAKKNTKRAYTSASVLQVLGIDLIIVPTVVLPLLGGASSFPFVFASVVTGIPMVIYSTYLFRKMPPKEYKLSEWQFK